MEQQCLYLECAEEDKRKDQHKVADLEVKPGGCWATPQTVVKLLPDWKFQLQTEAVPLLNPANQKLFVHNNHWRNKHVVTVRLCGMARQGQLKQRARGQDGEGRQEAKVGCGFCCFGNEWAGNMEEDARREDR